MRVTFVVRFTKAHLVFSSFVLCYRMPPCSMLCVHKTKPTIIFPPTRARHTYYTILVGIMRPSCHSSLSCDSCSYNSHRRSLFACHSRPSCRYSSSCLPASPFLSVLLVLLLFCPLPSDPFSCTVLFSPSSIVFTFFLFLAVLIFCPLCPSCVYCRFWLFRPAANSAISFSSPFLPGSFCLMLPRWPLSPVSLLSIFLPSSCLSGCLHHLTSVARLALPVLLTLLAICAPSCES
jgi:hypothetical protein